METSYLKTLELDKIVARAAEGCVCKEAREMLLATQPQCDPDEVRYALEQTDAINTLLIKHGSPRFGGVENVSQLAARAVKGGVLSMGELLMVAGALRNFQNLSSWYGASEHDALPTDDLFYALAPQPGLEQQISSAILAPDAMADTASHTLNDLRKKIRATENSIRDRLESMVRNMDTSKYLQESVVSMRNGRYVVPVKSEYRGEVSGIIHDVSSTGATVFVEPQAVVEANARILQYRAQEAQAAEGEFLLIRRGGQGGKPRLGGGDARTADFGAKGFGLGGEGEGGQEQGEDQGAHERPLAGLAQPAPRPPGAQGQVFSAPPTAPARAAGGRGGGRRQSLPAAPWPRPAPCQSGTAAGRDGSRRHRAAAWHRPHRRQERP